VGRFTRPGDALHALESGPLPRAGASAPGEEASVRKQQRKVDHYGNGPCEKYDASCAEHTSTMLQWCEDQLRAEYLEEKARCPEDGSHKACEEAAHRAYRDRVLACIGP
jgi:hypothetical protein